MGLIYCDVEFGEEENDFGFDTPCVYVTCPRCQETEMSWGQGSKSIKRSCILLAQNCPKDCGHFLTGEGDPRNATET